MVVRCLPVSTEGESEGGETTAGARQAVLVSCVLWPERWTSGRDGAQQVVWIHPGRQKNQELSGSKLLSERINQFEGVVLLPLRFRLK